MNQQYINESHLDNPVWFSLKAIHKNFALGNDLVQCYDPVYCAFTAVGPLQLFDDFLLQYANTTHNFFIVGHCPKLPASLTVQAELECLQMIIRQPIELPVTETIIHLGRQHAQEVEDLVNLVQPGYFREKTFLLGNYYGIVVDDQLVAIAGERMQMDTFIEVSAVVSHPLHTGKGYAKQLVAHSVNQIFKQNKIPFLHVLESNVTAIALYNKLGFKTRRKMNFWKISLAGK